MQPSVENLPKGNLIVLQRLRDSAAGRFMHQITQEQLAEFRDLKILLREVTKEYKKQKRALETARRHGAPEEAGALTLTEVLTDVPGYAVPGYTKRVLDVVEQWKTG